MSTPDQPPQPSGWGEPPQPRYGQYGQGEYGQGQYGHGQYGQPAPPAGQYGQAPQQGQHGYGPGRYTPPAAKPGIVPLRPLGLGELYDGAFGAIRHNPGVMLGAATLVLLIATVLGVLVGQLWVPALSGLFGEYLTPDVEDELAVMGYDSAYFAQIFAASMGMGLTAMVATPVIEGILTVSVSQSVIGRKLSVSETWQRLRPRVWVLIGWALLRSLAAAVLFTAYVLVAVLAILAVAQGSEGLAVLLGLLFFFAGMALFVWVWVRLLMVAPALALEGQRLWATVGRAWRLTRQSFWRLFGIMLLTGIIVSIVASIITWPLSMVPAMSGSNGAGFDTLLITTLSSVISSALATIFTSAVVALLYIDLRMRREGLDVALAAAAAQAAEPQPGPR
jgi:MFS family permease